MKTIATLAFAFIVGYLLVVSYSHSVSAQSEDTSTPTPTRTPSSTATPTSTPASTPTPALQTYLTVQGANIAVLGKADASVEIHSATGAHDGDSDTMWNSQHFSPQWLSIEFDEFHLVNKIELIVSQHEPGPTTHEIWLRNDSHATTFYQRLVNVQTEDGQTVEVFVDPPQHIDKVYILTSQSQGWVAWREVRVFNAIELRNWQLESFVSGVELPVQVTHAGDSSGRLFVVEHKGRIRIIKDGVINDTPFLDISDRVSCCGEQGFYVVAFPPSYVDRQHFYVSYVNLNDDLVISRFKTTSHPDIADPDSEEILLTIVQPHAAHNGGYMAFGPKDGYLYIGSGDGGAIEDKPNGQDPDTLLGKILRIDVESGGKPYDIPASNPFVGVEGYRDEIWTLGIRNPWGFAFDRQTGEFYIPDAGEGRREEVNFQSAASEGGENYGWAVWQGNTCYEFHGSSCDVADVILPVTVYDHTQGRCVIVGGAVYQGTFLYADFCSGTIWGLQRRGDRWQSTRLIDRSTPISSISTDETGNVYVAGYPNGVIYRLISSKTEEESEQDGTD